MSKPVTLGSGPWEARSNLGTGGSTGGQPIAILCLSFLSFVSVFLHVCLLVLAVVLPVVFASVDCTELSLAHLVGYIVVNSLYRLVGVCLSIESQWREVCRSGTRGWAVVVVVAVVCGDAMVRKREQRQKPQNNREPRIGWFRFSRCPYEVGNQLLHQRCSPLSYRRQGAKRNALSSENNCGSAPGPLLTLFGYSSRIIRYAETARCSRHVPPTPALRKALSIRRKASNDCEPSLAGLCSVHFLATHRHINRPSSNRQPPFIQNSPRTNSFSRRRLPFRCTDNPTDDTTDENP